MPDVVKDLDEALQGWSRTERVLPDYTWLTETVWTREADHVRHVGGMGTDEIPGRGRTTVCLITAEISGASHVLPAVEPVSVLKALIGGRDAS